MIRQLLVSIGILLVALGQNSVKAQSIDQIILPSSPVLSCNGGTITVNATQLCINYVYDSPTQSIVGNTILLNLNWSTVSPICLGALGFVQEPFSFSSFPPGVNTVEVRTFLDGVQQSLATVNLSVASCCPASASFTSNFNSVCVANEDSFNFTNTSTGSISQNWYVDDVLQSTASNFSFFQDIPGSYSIKLVVTDGSCSDSTEQTVNVYSNPTPDLGEDIESCENNSEALSVSSSYSNYVWSFFANNSPAIVVSNSNTYYVVVTDANGCEGSDTINVNFNPLPEVDLGSDTTLCNGQSLDLDAGNYSSFSWSTGDISQLINVNSADTFSVLVADSIGCEGEDEIIVSTAPNPVLDLGPDTVSICNGDSVLLDAGIHSSYTWSTNESTQTISVITEDVYAVTVTNSANCFTTDSIFVQVYDLPNISLPDSITLCQDSSITLDAGNFSSFLWSDSSSNQTLTLDSSSLSIGSNVLGLTVTDSNGCSSSTDLVLSLIACNDPSTSLISNQLDTEISIFPNPCQAILKIELEKILPTIEYSLMDLSGRIHFHEVHEQTNTIHLETSSLVNGVYVIHLRTSDSEAFIKFVKN